MTSCELVVLCLAADNTISDSCALWSDFCALLSGTAQPRRLGGCFFFTEAMTTLNEIAVGMSDPLEYYPKQATVYSWGLRWARSRVAALAPPAAEAVAAVLRGAAEDAALKAAGGGHRGPREEQQRRSNSRRRRSRRPKPGRSPTRWVSFGCSPKLASYATRGHGSGTQDLPAAAARPQLLRPGPPRLRPGAPRGRLRARWPPT